MTDIKLTNSLSGKKEIFKPKNPPEVGVYTCGPTVYDRSTIGNLRTYTTSDLLVRTLKYARHNVTHVMNLTDVGHLTGDNLGDADTGEDRMEKEARKEGKNAWDIAKQNIEEFKQDVNKLNLQTPDHLPKATDHIKEQVDLVQKLEKKGFTYKTSDGVYFDTRNYEEVTGRKYGELSTMDRIKEGARVEANPEKKNERDFALWKFSEKPGERHMEWESPWGVGFPGWHIECSAMSMKYLGESFDIHVGGEDLRQTHHPNEIAQSEGATEEKFVNYWIHVTFLQVDGKKMGKSLGNAYTIGDIEDKGFEPLALRYLYLTAHYKDTLNFTWDALQSSQNSLNKLRDHLVSFRQQTDRSVLSEEKRKKMDDYRQEFEEAIYDDLSTPKAMATAWKVIKSNIPSGDRYDLVMTFDEVLGLNLKNAALFEQRLTSELEQLLEERESLRKSGEFEKADELRKEIEKKGFKVKDTSEGPKLIPIRK